MATLTLYAGTSSAVNIECQNAGELEPTTVGSVKPSFNGADRNGIKAIKRNYGALVDYIDTATKDSIINGLKTGNPVACSGDLFGNIQTLCTVKYTASRIVPSIGLWEVALAMTEVNPNLVLLKYAPGDTITGESFSRSTVAYQMGTDGIYVSKAVDAKRDGHYTAIGGIRSTLLEGGRINSCLRSNNLTVTWVQTSAGSSAFTATGLDGTANTATTITDSDATATTAWQQAFVVANDSATHCVAFWIKKDAVTTRFPLFGVQLSGGTPIIRAVSLNTSTGAAVLNSGGSGTNRVVDAGLWWVLEITINNNTTGNTTLTLTLEPAYGTAINVLNNAATGSIVVGNVQVELNATFFSSPIFTTTGTAVRGPDNYSLPFTSPPGETTVSIKFVESGTLQTSISRVWQISSAADTNPRLLVYSTPPVYTVYHGPTALTAVSSTLGVTPAMGAVVELSTRLFGDGSIDLTQSINSAAATASLQSPSATMATAWSGLLAWLNSSGSTQVGFIAIQSFRITAGVRSLSEMRAA